MNNFELKRIIYILRLAVFSSALLLSFSASAAVTSIETHHVKTAKTESSYRSLGLGQRLFLCSLGSRLPMKGSELADLAAVLGFLALFSTLLITKGAFFFVLAPVLAILAIVFGRKAKRIEGGSKADKLKATFGIVAGVLVLSLGLIIFLAFVKFARG